MQSSATSQGWSVEKSQRQTRGRAVNAMAEDQVARRWGEVNVELKLHFLPPTLPNEFPLNLLLFTHKKKI